MAGPCLARPDLAKITLRVRIATVLQGYQVTCELRKVALSSARLTYGNCGAIRPHDEV
jgi:hypothetical protein